MLLIKLEPKPPILSTKVFKKHEPTWGERPIHRRQAQNIPTNPPPDSIFWFDLIWHPELYEMISNNTNKYALQASSDATWKVTTAAEISIWIGLTIYMGLYRIGKPREYWATGEFKPTFPPMRYMSRNRWLAIKRYFYICDPSINKTFWFEKVSPLSDVIFRQS